MAADSDGAVLENVCRTPDEIVTTVVTCEGDYYDPEFHDKFKVTLGKLEDLLCDDAERLSESNNTLCSISRKSNNFTEGCEKSLEDKGVKNVTESNRVEMNKHTPDTILDKIVPTKPPDKPRERLKISKLEPWNSVRVTLSIPKEAAVRLRQLASEGSAQLRQLGILSVQVEGDQVISLRIASRFGNNCETQEILLNTAQENTSLSAPNQTTSGVTVNIPSTSQQAISLTRLLQGATAIPSSISSTGPSTITLPNQPIAIEAKTFPQATRPQSEFRSPNVICPTDSQVPLKVALAASSTMQIGTKTSLVPTGTPKNQFSEPLQRPFPFASMQQAAQAIQNRSSTTSNPADFQHQLTPAVNSSINHHTGNISLNTRSVGTALTSSVTVNKNLSSGQSTVPVSQITSPHSTLSKVSTGASNITSTVLSGNQISSATSQSVQNIVSSLSQPNLQKPLTVNQSSLGVLQKTIPFTQPPPPYPATALTNSTNTVPASNNQSSSPHQIVQNVLTCQGSTPNSSSGGQNIAISSPLLVNLLQNDGAPQNSQQKPQANVEKFKTKATVPSPVPAIVTPTQMPGRPSPSATPGLTLPSDKTAQSSIVGSSNSAFATVPQVVTSLQGLSSTLTTAHESGKYQDHKLPSPLINSITTSFVSVQQTTINATPGANIVQSSSQNNPVPSNSTSHILSNRQNVKSPLLNVPPQNSRNTTQPNTLISPATQHQRLQQTQQLRNLQLIQQQQLNTQQNRQNVLSGQLHQQRIGQSIKQFPDGSIRIQQPVYRTTIGNSTASNFSTNEHQFVQQNSFTVASTNNFSTQPQAPPPYPSNRQVINRTALATSSGFQQDFQQRLQQQNIQQVNRIQTNWPPNATAQFSNHGNDLLPIGEPMPSLSQLNQPQSVGQPLSTINLNNIALDTNLSNITPSITDLSKSDLDSLLPSLTDIDGADLISEIANDIVESGLDVVPEPAPIEIPEELTSRGKRRLFLINPLSGVLEPMPSESSSSESETEEGEIKKKKSAIIDVFSELNERSNSMFSDDDTSSTTVSASKRTFADATTTDQSDSEATIRSTTSDTGSVKTTSHRNKNTIKNRDRTSRDSPNLAKVAKSSSNKEHSSMPNEKIKLRLKLEKSEPVNPAYKVDVSFINRQEPKRANVIASTNVTSISAIPKTSNTSSSSIPAPLVGPITPAGSSEEPRVPPLHISLRGRNSVVISNKSSKKHLIKIGDESLTDMSEGEKVFNKKSKVRKDKDGSKVKNRSVTKDNVLIKSGESSSKINNILSSTNINEQSSNDIKVNDIKTENKLSKQEIKTHVKTSTISTGKIPVIKTTFGGSNKPSDIDDIPLTYRREPGEISMPPLKTLTDSTKKNTKKSSSKINSGDSYREQREQNLLSGGSITTSVKSEENFRNHKKVKTSDLLESKNKSVIFKSRSDKMKNRSDKDRERSVGDNLNESKRINESIDSSSIGLKIGVKRQHAFGSDPAVVNNGTLHSENKKRRLSDHSSDSSKSLVSSKSSGTSSVQSSIGSTNVGTVLSTRKSSSSSSSGKSSSLQKLNSTSSSSKLKRDRPLSSSSSKNKDASDTKESSSRSGSNSSKSKDLNRDKTYSKIVAEKRLNQSHSVDYLKNETSHSKSGKSADFSTKSKSDNTNDSIKLKYETLKSSLKMNNSLGLPTAGELDMEAKFKQRLLENTSGDDSKLNRNFGNSEKSKIVSKSDYKTNNIINRLTEKHDSGSSKALNKNTSVILNRVQTNSSVTENILQNRLMGHENSNKTEKLTDQNETNVKLERQVDDRKDAPNSDKYLSDMLRISSKETQDTLEENLRQLLEQETDQSDSNRKSREDTIRSEDVNLTQILSDSDVDIKNQEYQRKNVSIVGLRSNTNKSNVDQEICKGNISAAVIDENADNIPDCQNGNNMERDLNSLCDQHQTELDKSANRSNSQTQPNRSPPLSNSTGQGEDSGIESMDALSEKSPNNQASQSPHCHNEISNLVETLTGKNSPATVMKYSSVENKTFATRKDLTSESIIEFDKSLNAVINDHLHKNKHSVSNSPEDVVLNNRNPKNMAEDLKLNDLAELGDIEAELAKMEGYGDSNGGNDILISHLSSKQDSIDSKADFLKSEPNLVTQLKTDLETQFRVDQNILENEILSTSDDILTHLKNIDTAKNEYLCKTTATHTLQIKLEKHEFDERCAGKKIKSEQESIDNKDLNENKELLKLNIKADNCCNEVKPDENMIPSKYEKDTESNLDSYKIALESNDIPSLSSKSMYDISKEPKYISESIKGDSDKFVINSHLNDEISVKNKNVDNTSNMSKNLEVKKEVPGSDSCAKFTEPVKVSSKISTHLECNSDNQLDLDNKTETKGNFNTEEHPENFDNGELVHSIDHDDFDPLPMRRTPPLYTYSNPDKQLSRNESESPIPGLSDFDDCSEYHSDVNSEDLNDMSATEKERTKQLSPDNTSASGSSSTTINIKNMTLTRRRKQNLDNLILQQNLLAEDSTVENMDEHYVITKSKTVTNSTQQKSLLEQLLIEIPNTELSEKTSISSMSHSPAVSDKSLTSTKSSVRTRSSSKLNSPDISSNGSENSKHNLRTPKHSPSVVLKPCDNSRDNSPAHVLKAGSKVNQIAKLTAGIKRKRRESESSTQSTQSIEDSLTTHSTRNKKSRKCSENAAELIKACMGVDSQNQNSTIIVETQASKRTNSPIKVNAQCPNRNIKNVLSGAPNEESSDSDEPLIEVAGKVRSSNMNSSKNTTMATRNNKISNPSVQNVIVKSANNVGANTIMKSSGDEQKIINTRRSVRNNAGVNVGNSIGLKTRSTKLTGENSNEAIASRRKTRSAVSESVQDKRTRRSSKDGK